MQLETIKNQTDVKERIGNLLEYLIEYSRLKSPPKLEISEYQWHLSLASLPIHPCVEVYIQAPEELEERVVLQVSRPELADCPEPPEFLKPWLRTGWKAYEKKDAFLVHPSEITGDEDHADEGEGEREGADQGDPVFQHPPEVLEAFSAWSQERQEWRVVETPARQTNQLFDRFFELKSTLEREGEKFAITLGTGILRWHTDGKKKVEHHVLSQRCSLSFDSSIPRFSVSFSEDALQFPTNLLRDVADVDLSGLPNLVDSLRHATFDILGEEADDFLTGLARRLWSQGEYYDSPVVTVPTHHPTLQKTPVLILEPRGRGYVDTAQHLLMNLENFVPPAALCDLVGLPLQFEEGQRAAAATMPLLFTKPSNLEQERVARRLASNQSVLVQGPPGTGKTHTIANLIGHLLAQGKSILVTSHTSKALGVVRDKVAPELQGLCVSVLDDGNQGQQQLAAAVAAIADKLTETTADELEQDAGVLKRQLEHLEKQLEDAQGQLLAAHRNEYEVLSVAGETVMPSEAAKKLRDWSGNHDWIPGAVSASQACPLSDAEVRELYQLQALVTAQEEDQIAAGIPPTSELPTPQDFEKLCNRRAEILEAGVDSHKECWQDREPSAELLEKLLDGAAKAVAAIEPDQAWALECLSAGGNQAEGALWTELCDQVEETVNLINGLRSLVLDRGPQIAPLNMPLRRQLEVCEEITAQVKGKGKLGIFAYFKSEWKQFRAACSLDGHPPERLEDYEALKAQLQITAARKKLLARWKRQTEGLGFPSLSPDSPERDAASLAPRMRAALQWRETDWKAFEKALGEAGFDWPNLLKAQASVETDKGQILKTRAALTGPLSEAVEAKRRAQELKAMDREVERSGALLAGFDSVLCTSLTEALKAANPVAYRSQFEELKRLELQVARVKRRAELLTTLQAEAAEWANCIAQRMAPHGAGEPPGPLREAWLFAQWSQQLRVRHSLDLDQLQQRCSSLKDQIRRCTARYVEVLTWKFQAQRTGNAQQQALVGWLQLVRKIGKGTGKQAPRLKAKARERLRECREAVPVWIMPFSRVVESYRPGETLFDVVIVDEASQADVTGLLALTLGRELVVVGDHEQVSPSAIGEKADKVMSLAEEHLRLIPNKELFDGGSSVYDMAQRAFGETIRLKEHFRCVPEIIAFSNQLCYEGQIRPLRESDNLLRPAVVSHHVPDGVRQGRAKTNDQEAKEIATLIAACCEHPLYAGKTFGVISLVGDEQAYLIEKYITSKLDVRTIEERRILCGNSAQFQGDERDVMFLSMVDSPSGNGPLRLVGSNKAMVQRYNVAASRAKDQMWIVHSLDPGSDLKADDIRLQLIQSSQRCVVQELDQLMAQTESVFEEQVLERVVQAGYRVIPQLPIGSYRVDMVVIGEQGRVAIECDGDRYHPPEQLEADLARQELLERVANLTFIRIRGSAYFREPEATMRGVFQRLQELGVEKLGPEREVDPNDGARVREEVCRRAGEIQRQWWPEDSKQSQVSGDELWAEVLSALKEWPSLDILPCASEMEVSALTIQHNTQEIILLDRSSPELKRFCEQAKADFVEVLVVDPGFPDDTRHQILAAFELLDMVDSRELPALPENAVPSVEPLEAPDPAREEMVAREVSQSEAIVSILMDVAKADGVLLPEELQQIPRFFARRFSYDAAALTSVQRLIQEYAEQQPPRAEVAKAVRQMDQSLKELLLKAALELAWSDQEFHENEKRVIVGLGMEFDISKATVEALMKQADPNAHDPYQALELENDASMETIEAAVTKLRERFSEAKVETLGPEFKELAATRREEVDKAWEQIHSRTTASYGDRVLGTEPEESGEPESADRVAVLPSDVIEAYGDFIGTAGPPPDQSTTSEVMNGLLSIIACEGPVQVRRAFKLYLDGCGIKKLGSQLKIAMFKALKLGVRDQKFVVQSEVEGDDPLDQFVRLRECPQVRVRELGARSFDEVSLYEIAEMGRRLEACYPRRSETHIGALADFYHIGRQTTRIKARLEQAIDLRESLGGEAPMPNEAPSFLSSVERGSPVEADTEKTYTPADLADKPRQRLTQLEQAVLLLFEDKPRRQEIVKQRLGLGRGEILTLQELGDAFGVTRERVRQLESKSVKEVSTLLEVGQARGVSLHPELLEWWNDIARAVREAAPTRVTLRSAFLASLSSILDFEPDLEKGLIKFLLQQLGLSVVEGRFYKTYLFRGMSPADIDDTLSWLGELEATFRSIPTTWSREDFRNEFGREAERHGLSLDDLLGLLPLELLADGQFRVPLHALTGRANQAFRVLSDHGAPLHFEEITRIINESGAKEVDARNLINQAATDDRLIPVGRSGQWALVEWGEEGTATIKDCMIQVMQASGEPLSAAEIWQQVRELRACSPNSVKVYLASEPTFKRVGMDAYTYDSDAESADDWVFDKVGVWIEEFFRRSFQSVVPLENLRKSIQAKASDADDRSLAILLGHHPALESMPDRSGKTLVALRQDWRLKKKRRKRRQTLQDEVNDFLRSYLSDGQDKTLNEVVNYLVEETGSPSSGIYGYVDRSPYCQKFERDGSKYLKLSPLFQR